MIKNLLLNRDNWDKTAVIEEERTYSYGDLAGKAAAVQLQLAAQQPENVAIFLPNGADYIAALFGVWTAGKTAFPLSVMLTAHEIAPLLLQAEASTVITGAAYRPFFAESGLAARLIFMEDLSPLDPGDLPEAGVNAPDQPIILLTTSGTTGRAKIVQLTERNIETTVFGFIAYNDYPRFSGAEIRYILGTPFSSVYGLLIVPVCIIMAFPIIVPEGAFTLDVFYRAVEKHRATHYEGGTAIPILMEQMLGRPIPYDIGTLRFVGFGGSKVAARILRRLDQAFPRIEFCPGYGTTESAALIARPYKQYKPEKRNSIGTAIPNVRVKVEVDGDLTDAPLSVGELVVSGPNLTPGYYRDEEETGKIIKNGWLYTGDIGYIDADGDIFICGRKKNVIMVRGFSVYAEEVEESLQSSGLVKDCVVYGQADASGNEMLCADVIPLLEAASEADLRAWCVNHLAAYKRPHRIRLVEAIAKTATGKTGRNVGNSHEAD